MRATTSHIDLIPLLPPRLWSACSVEEALRTRRSIREYGGASLAAVEVGQLLWAAQGVTADDGLRTTPSAGGIFPLCLLPIGRMRDDARAHPPD
jgi:hypothetical protein